MVWIQIRPDILLELIWVQTVYIFKIILKQRTKVAAGREIVNLDQNALLSLLNLFLLCLPNISGFKLFDMRSLIIFLNRRFWGKKISRRQKIVQNLKAYKEMNLAHPHTCLVVYVISVYTPINLKFKNKIKYIISSFSDIHITPSRIYSYCTNLYFSGQQLKPYFTFS